MLLRPPPSPYRNSILHVCVCVCVRHCTRIVSSVGVVVRTAVKVPFLPPPFSVEGPAFRLDGGEGGVQWPCLVAFHTCTFSHI
jgi:hypothetical protein